MILLYLLISTFSIRINGFSAPGIIPPETFIAERWYPSNLPTVMPPWKMPGADLSHFQTARPHQSPGTTTTLVPPTNTLPMPPGTNHAENSGKASLEPHPPSPHIKTDTIQPVTIIPVKEEEDHNSLSKTTTDALTVTVIPKNINKPSLDNNTNGLPILSPNFEDITKVDFENGSEIGNKSLMVPNVEDENMEEASGQVIEESDNSTGSTTVPINISNSTTTFIVPSTTTSIDLNMFGAMKNDSNMIVTIKKPEFEKTKPSTVPMTTDSTTTSELPSTNSLVEVSTVTSEMENGEKSNKECKDIIFLLDSSGNVVQQYEKQKKYIEDIVSSLERTNNRRFALITFAGRSRQKIVASLPDEPNGQLFIEKLRKARFLRGVTATGAAISVTTQYVLQKGRNVQVVVVTDGFSFDDVHQQAEALRSIGGVETYATGRYFPIVRNVLLSIGGAEDHVFFDKNEAKLIDKLKC